MAAQPLRSAAALGFALDRLEHPCERSRIVPGPRHDLRAQEVGLLLEIAAVLQQQRAETELTALSDGRAGGATDHGPTDDPRDLAELQPRVLCLRRIGRAVAEQHVRQLVRHDPDDLGLDRRGVEHPAVDEHRAARKGEGIDLLQVHGRERVLVDGLLQFRRCTLHQAIAEHRQIPGDGLVLDDGILLTNFGGGLSSKLHVLLGRVLVLRQLDSRLAGERASRQQQG